MKMIEWPFRECLKGSKSCAMRSDVHSCLWTTKVKPPMATSPTTKRLALVGSWEVSERWRLRKPFLQLDGMTITRQQCGTRRVRCHNVFHALTPPYPMFQKVSW